MQTVETLNVHHFPVLENQKNQFWAKFQLFSAPKMFGKSERLKKNHHYRLFGAFLFDFFAKKESFSCLMIKIETQEF